MSDRHLAAVPERPNRVVLYVRVSALMGRDGDTFHSPELQVGAMRRATTGMREVTTIEDIDVSGTTFSRRGLDQVRELVKAGQVDVIAVYDLSRLGRNVLESLQFLAWLNERGVRILSACEQIDTSTPAGEMMLINMLSIAQFRSREIGRAWSAIIARRAQHGRHHGATPTGYRRGDDGALIEDPVTGSSIRAAFLDYAAGGAVADIRRRLQAATGAKLDASTLKRLLRNEVYRGVVQIKGGPRITNAHEPLVDADTWRRVQRRAEQSTTLPPRYQSPRYSLTGLGRCGICHRATVVRVARGVPMLVCGQAWRSHCAGCGSPHLVSVENAVLEAVRGYLAELRGDVAAQAARMARATRAGVDAEALERELADVRAAMVRLTERWARERRDDAMYEAALDKLRGSERQLVDQLDDAQEIASGPTAPEVVRLGEHLIARWAAMDGSQRNRALREVIDHFTLRPSTRHKQPATERIEIMWR